MGKRGRIPTPLGELKARGSWRAKKRAQSGELQLPSEKPACPSELSKEAKAEWARQVKQLHEHGVIAKVDRAALAVWCEAWADYVHALEVIAKGEGKEETGKGMLAVGSTGNLVVNPMVRIKNAAAEKLIQVAQQFGFTPAARARIQTAAVAGEEEVDPFTEFLNERGKNSA